MKSYPVYFLNNYCWIFKLLFNILNRFLFFFYTFDDGRKQLLRLFSSTLFIRTFTKQRRQLTYSTILLQDLNSTVFHRKKKQLFTEKTSTEILFASSTEIRFENITFYHKNVPIYSFASPGHFWTSRKDVSPSNNFGDSEKN